MTSTLRLQPKKCQGKSGVALLSWHTQLDRRASAAFPLPPHLLRPHSKSIPGSALGTFSSLDPCLLLPSPLTRGAAQSSFLSSSALWPHLLSELFLRKGSRTCHPNMPLRHINDFELLALKKQQTQEEAYSKLLSA